LGLAYTLVDPANPDDWRRNGTVGAIAAAIQADLDLNRPPLVVIDEQAFDYSGAMKFLKTKLDPIQIR